MTHLIYLIGKDGLEVIKMIFSNPIFSKVMLYDLHAVYVDGQYEFDEFFSSTVRCKTIAMSNPKPGHKVPYNQSWEFHFALVGTNKVQTSGYNFVPRVM